MSKDLNVCLFPLCLEWDNIMTNLNALESALESMRRDTDLLILPETFTTGFPSGKSSEEISDMVAKYQDVVINTICNLARKYNIAICGSIVYYENGELFNRALFIEPNKEITFADKRHLFSMAGENEIFTPGNKRLGIRYRGWNIAMVVCYDVRFPVWCRNVGNEYDLLIAVANWPEVRISAWNKLLPARAIENEAYVCAVNCKGTDPKDFTYDGSSLVVDFKGNVICENSTDNSDTNEMIYAKLNREALERFREKFPAFTDADSFKIFK